ncbi:MAG: TrmH family RNA methyltransferase [Fervidicoccaceae archaeon]
MDNLRLVLVDTEGSVNLGMILRLAANFSIKDIHIVSTREYNEEEVLRYAVRAGHLYHSIVRHVTIEDALNGCDIKICTTAKGASDDILRNTVSSLHLPELVSKYKNVCLVFGRESTGLTREELSKCDLASTIPTSEEYPALNLSNSVAIYLYELTAKKKTEPIIETASREDIESTISTFSQISALVHRDPHKVERASRAFRQIIYKSSPSRMEIRVVHHVLRRALRRIQSESK